LGTAFDFGEIRVLFSDALQRDAPKRFAHLAGSSEPRDGPHLAMRFGLSAGSIRCSVEHATEPSTVVSEPKSPPELDPDAR
jgi:hypothetical protein